jgi:hypothetical protein
MALLFLLDRIYWMTFKFDHALFLGIRIKKTVNSDDHNSI